MAGSNVTLPQAGDEVTASWGQDVAKGLNGIQAGVANVQLAAAPSGTLVITFPKPYVAAPNVVVAQGANSAGYIAAVGEITATTCKLTAATRGGTNGTASIGVQWIAVGTLA